MKRSRCVNPTQLNSEADFWSKVSGRDKNDECWPWMGARIKTGYGRFHYKGKEVKAHRFAFWLANSFYPQAVCPKCDNPPCCNPSHLFAGNPLINNRDATAKGRNHRPVGVLHPGAKINEDDVRTIRELRKSGIKPAELSRRYSLHPGTIWSIVKGKKWTHV